jgi:hypothetical protein
MEHAAANAILSYRTSTTNKPTSTLPCPSVDSFVSTHNHLGSFILGSFLLLVVLLLVMRLRHSPVRQPASSHHRTAITINKQIHQSVCVTSANIKNTLAFASVSTLRTHARRSGYLRPNLVPVPPAPADALEILMVLNLAVGGGALSKSATHRASRALIPTSVAFFLVVGRPFSAVYGFRT